MEERGGRDCWRRRINYRSLTCSFLHTRLADFWTPSFRSPFPLPPVLPEKKEKKVDRSGVGVRVGGGGMVGAPLAGRLKG